MSRSSSVSSATVSLWVLFLCAGYGHVSAMYDCTKLEYNRCISIADPLIKEARLIFPDNMNDIDKVCRAWNDLVDCLKKYTERCFTDQQRRQFNKAVENPIESVHQMCTQPVYQKEYLRYAPCIKSTITEKSHCGSHYSLLVDQVSQGDAISKARLCCSHHRFKQCVLSETKRSCDRGADNGPAQKFSSQTVDKSLSFLQEQCLNYIPNSGDCSPQYADSKTITDSFTLGSVPSEVYPWSTIHEAAGKEMPSKVTYPPSASSASNGPDYYPPLSSKENLPTSIGNSAAASVTQTQTQGFYSSNPTDTGTGTTRYPGGGGGGAGSSNDPAEQGLGSRTRPASYGRSNTWSQSPMPSTDSSHPEWATVSSWHPASGVQQQTSTETWYPAAGSHVGNELDEPNQQGLSKPKNNSSATHLTTSWLLTATFASLLLILARFC